MNNPERANSIITQLKDTITNKAHAFSVTFTDLFATHYGINLNAPITYNEQLSNAVTNLFTNTEVKVYLFQSAKVAIVSIPGTNKNNSPEALRYRYNVQIASAAMASQGGLIISPYAMSQMTENYAMAVENANKEGGETRLTYDPSTNKLTMNVSEVTVYISTNYINCLDYDDEIIASILQQVAVNTKVMKNHYVNTGTGIGILLSTIIAIISMGFAPSPNKMPDWLNDPKYKELHGREALDTYHKDVDVAMQPVTSYLLKVLMWWGFSLLVAIGINIYISRGHNIEYDEFVVKCGYGDALRRAVANYNKYKFGDSSTKSDALKHLNMFEKVCHWFNKLFGYVGNVLNWFGITSHQSIGQRDETIANKTAIYNQKNPNEYLDRTDSIAECLAMIDKDVKILNS